MPEIVLEVKNLTVYREKYVAVRNISFSLAAGTNTAIIGPNGAGKSTLVQAILGIIPHQSGNIRVLDHSLSQKGYLPNRVRDRLFAAKFRF